MGTIGLLMRAVPFLATFAFGLFVASFFVDINPRFEHHERGRCHHDMWEMRIENEQLREENRQLREQVDELNIPPTEMGVNGDSEEVLDPSGKVIYPTFPAKGAGEDPKTSKAHK